MTSEPDFIWAWLYFDGNIINNSVDGVLYDKRMTRLMKVQYDLRYDQLVNLLYTKLSVDSTQYRLKILCRFMNHVNNKFEVAPICDDDDVQFMFESVTILPQRKYIELYVEKFLIDLENNSVDIVPSFIVSATSEQSSRGEGIGTSGNVSSDSSSKSLYMTRIDSNGNSRESSEYKDDEIPHYKSFDGSSMVLSYSEPIMQKVGDVLNTTELRKGMVFETKKELTRIVKGVHISNHQEIKVIKSDALNWEVACKQKSTGCSWNLRARKRKLHGFFEIMEIVGPHTCLNPTITQDHYNLNSSNIAETIRYQVVADPTVSEKVLMATTVSNFGYTPTRKKIRDAKQLAIKNVYGSWEQSYQDLPAFMNALQSFNIGTHVDWYFKEYDLGESTDKVATFKRVFWALKPCIDAFPHCIPVIQIDGTHLYGKYRGVLLTATTIDGFNHLLLLAFAIVEGENISSWTWFMERLRKLVVLNRHGLCVISDRHAGIISAMNNQELGWCEPYDHHRFCIRHLSANFAKEFKKKNLKERVVTIASQLTPAKFYVYWNELLQVEPRADAWFADKDLRQWALAFDEGKRFGIMTTNIAESWNNAIKTLRKLPITALVKSIFYKVVEYFDQRRLEIEKQAINGNNLTKHANIILNKWKTRATGHQVKIFDRNTWLFEVITMKRGQKGGNQQIVRLMEGTCTCIKWQTFHLPCSHVLAACASQNLDHTGFIGDWYKLNNAKKVYASEFEPIPDQSRWPGLGEFPAMIHDEENVINKVGRRQSTRYKNHMDYQGFQKNKNVTQITGANNDVFGCYTVVSYCKQILLYLNFDRTQTYGRWAVHMDMHLPVKHGLSIRES